MKKILTGTITGLALLGALAMVAPALAATNGGGFNQYGYNYGARVFNGTYSSWAISEGLPADYMGIYSNDHLVMKWNAQWDNCNNNGYVNPQYCLGAWLDNEINGKVPGGSGEIWHYKIIWVGPQGTGSPYWIPGGELTWGNYETLMDQGFDPNSGPGHMWFASTTPNGYGSVNGK